MLTFPAMKALLVDPAEQTVTSVDIGKTGVLAELREHIGCKWVDSVLPVINKKDCTVYVDDEGLLKPSQTRWNLGEFELAGRAVIFGKPSQSGFDTACKLTPEELLEALGWTLSL